ncbi:hypothetical protein SAMN06295945_0033 [Polynucleobacter meluiroseus]|jgi:hypothetical protein|uniref:Uncharacterized protein n=1 Tax=Polynucleobacter meluiroseus TaxID=1938814 RepID=A0A240DXN5_9BURK|nr:hypothetical protein [Polynucleobacter meluiroseus]SNX27717.1 hypothetical protein SAMN06295945_0033 [Polynucleobacter meluiroseus]
MAAGQNQRNRKNDSMVTKTGKARLGPLNLAQLTKMLETSTKPKDKNKLQRAIRKFTPAIAPVVA